MILKTPEEYNLVIAPVCPWEDLSKPNLYRAPRPRHMRFVLHRHPVSAAEPSHELLPTHSCSCPALFLLPRTSHRATSPCFRPRRKVQPFQGPQTAWFRRPFLFSWSFRVCFSFSAASVQWFCPQNGPKHECITLLHALGNQQPAAAKNRIFWRQSWTSHLTPQYPQILATKENKQWCSLKQELFGSFSALQLQNFGSTEEII